MIILLLYRFTSWENIKSWMTESNVPHHIRGRENLLYGLRLQELVQVVYKVVDRIVLLDHLSGIQFDLKRLQDKNRHYILLCTHTNLTFDRKLKPHFYSKNLKLLNILTTQHFFALIVFNAGNGSFLVLIAKLKQKRKKITRSV